jgi:predicted  nucleic acid-binding Zn-ribbon protein
MHSQEEFAALLLELQRVREENTRLRTQLDTLRSQVDNLSSEIKVLHRDITETHPRTSDGVESDQAAEQLRQSDKPGE